LSDLGMDWAAARVAWGSSLATRTRYSDAGQVGNETD
jgi:hypothetical protein